MRRERDGEEVEDKKGMMEDKGKEEEDQKRRYKYPTINVDTYTLNERKEDRNGWEMRKGREEEEERGMRRERGKDRRV